MSNRFPTDRICTACVCILFLIIVTYSNSLHATWHLDDFQNILGNSAIHLTHISLTGVDRALHAYPLGHGLQRSLPNLTFALNWYIGQDHVLGYHIVNIAIHMIASIFLFLTILGFLAAPNLTDKFQKNDKYFIALLSAAFWAVNPIQTQAVTYIVQRMAEMAGMFYIAGLFFYVRGRLEDARGKRYFLYTVCALTYGLAMLSKPNAVTLPILIFLAEFIFFQDLSDPLTRRIAILLTVGGGLLLGAGGFFVFFGDSFTKLLNGYNARHFTLIERLLTEPRIVIFYLSQIFYPVPTRLSLVHTYPVSTSFFSPWTTTLCIVAIFISLCAAIYLIRRKPLLSFAILFFFLNHIIESSIIPLELVFEHRNYLPSMFLFVPVSIGILRAYQFYKAHNKIMYQILVAATILLLIGLGSGTYIRNMAWQTQKSLWEDALKKAPGSSRPYHNLAWGYYEQIGAYDKAIEYYKKALQHPYPIKGSRAQPYYSIGNLYDQKNETEKAIRYYKKSIGITEDYVKPQYNLATDYIKQGKYDEAKKHLDVLLGISPDNTTYLGLNGILFLDMHRFDQALVSFRKWLKYEPGNWQSYLYIGIAFNLMGRYDRSNWFLRRADQMHPKEAIVKLVLADNRYRAGYAHEARSYINAFIDIVGISDIQKFFNNLASDGYNIPFGFEKILPMIQAQMEDRIREISETAAHLTLGKNVPASR